MLALLLLVTTMATTMAQAKSHPHKGLLQPFPHKFPISASFLPTITPSDELLLSTPNSKGIRKLITSIHPITGVEDGTAIAVFDITGVDAGIVLGTIMDYKTYTRCVPKTLKSEVYSNSYSPTSYETNVVSPILNNNVLPSGSNGRKFDARGVNVTMIVAPLGRYLPPKLTFHVAHDMTIVSDSEVSIEEEITGGIITWSLDYEKLSDFLDSRGFWYVTTTKRSTDGLPVVRCYYSVRVGVYDWLPKSVVNVLKGKALEDATDWVMRWSAKNGIEKRAGGGEDSDLSYRHCDKSRRGGAGGGGGGGGGESGTRSKTSSETAKLRCEKIAEVVMAERGMEGGRIATRKL